MSTMGAAYNEYTSSHLQQVHWVSLTMSTLDLAYNKGSKKIARSLQMNLIRIAR